MRMGGPRFSMRMSHTFGEPLPIAQRSPARCDGQQSAQGPLIHARRLAELLLSTRGAQQRCESEPRCKVAAFQGLSCRRQCNKCRSRDRPNSWPSSAAWPRQHGFGTAFGAIPARTGRALGGERQDFVSEAFSLPAAEGPRPDHGSLAPDFGGLTDGVTTRCSTVRRTNYKCRAACVDQCSASANG